MRDAIWRGLLGFTSPRVLRGEVARQSRAGEGLRALSSWIEPLIPTFSPRKGGEKEINLLRWREAYSVTGRSEMSQSWPLKIEM
jgi:hypothetical protein